MRPLKFLAILGIVALISALSVLTARAQCATCPGGNCPRPSVVYAPKPIFRAPVRESLYSFLTPQGVVVQGYYRGPAQPVTREQALRNAAYWQAVADKLGAQR
jgi:hypothetical protein